MNLLSLWKGFLLGLGAAAPIGPVNIEIARRSIRGGIPAGFLLGCGAVTIDALYFLVAGVGLKLFLNYPGILIFMDIAGAGLLGFLGISSLRAAIRRLEPDVTGEIESPPPRRNYLTGLLMTAVNPMTLAFWFTNIGRVVGDSSTGRAAIVSGAVGVVAGALLWVCFFSALMSLARRAAKQRALMLADLAGGVMLLGFAALGVWQVVRRFL